MHTRRLPPGFAMYCKRRILADPLVLKLSSAKRIGVAIAADPDSVERRLVQAHVNCSARMANMIKALRDSGSTV